MTKRKSKGSRSRSVGESSGNTVQEISVTRKEGSVRDGKGGNLAYSKAETMTLMKTTPGLTALRTPPQSPVSHPDCPHSDKSTCASPGGPHPNSPESHVENNILHHCHK